MSDTTPVPDVQSWKTEFDSRIKAFSEAIGLDESEVRKELDALGADGKDDKSLTIIDDERFLPTGDLFEAFCDPPAGKVKKSRLRLGLPALRGKTSLSSASATYSNTDKLAEAVKDMAAANRPISTWTDKELLEAYNRDAVDVLKTLKARVHARPCIVFNPNGEVDVEVSLDLVKTAKRQPTSHEHSIDGRIVRVYRVGLFMPEYVDESPFYVGRVLVSGYCSKSGTQWKGVEHNNRVLIRIQSERFGTGSSLEMRELAHKAKIIPFDELRAYLGKAALYYDEMEREDKLPKLKILSKNAHDSGNTDTGFSK